MDRY
jgi:hypothetical protein